MLVGVGDGLALGDLAHQPLAGLVKATTDGTVRPPSALGMTTGSPPSMTATTEFVVPRSMPMILPMSRVLSCLTGRMARRSMSLVELCVCGGLCTGGDDDQRGPQDAVAKLVAPLELPGDGPLGDLVRWLHAHGLVQTRVE